MQLLMMSGFRVQWDAHCVDDAVCCDHDAGYMDGILAIIGHLDEPERDEG